MSRASVILEAKPNQPWHFNLADGFDVNAAGDILFHMPDKTTLLKRPNISEDMFTLQGHVYWGTQINEVWQIMGKKIVVSQLDCEQNSDTYLVTIPLAKTSQLGYAYCSRGGIFTTDPDSGKTLVRQKMGDFKEIPRMRISGRWSYYFDKNDTLCAVGACDVEVDCPIMHYQCKDNAWKCVAGKRLPENTGNQLFSQKATAHGLDMLLLNTDPSKTGSVQVYLPYDNNTKMLVRSSPSGDFIEHTSDGRFWHIPTPTKNTMVTTNRLGLYVVDRTQLVMYPHTIKHIPTPMDF